MQGARVLVFCTALCWLGCVDHALVHPRRTPPGVVEWKQQVVRGELQVRLQWARCLTAVETPLPTVIVHPEAGHTAAEMRGVLRDLAGRGYLAVAADYRRSIGGRYRQTLFAWRHPDDPRVVVDLVRASPWADPARVGLLGFSQGGVFSLLIAAQTGVGAAIVAYYPVTDFERWLAAPDRGPRARWVFRLIRRHFYRQSGARSEEEFGALLARASPLRQAERIGAPVLLVHGDRDRSAGVEESRRLAARLGELGVVEVQLLVIPGAGHVFNFRDREKADHAWQETLRWLDRHLENQAPF